MKKTIYVISYGIADGEGGWLEEPCIIGFCLSLKEAKAYCNKFNSDMDKFSSFGGLKYYFYKKVKQIIPNKIL